MKKFQFNLQKLLTFKEQSLEGELMELASLNHLMIQEEQAHEQLLGRRKSHRDQLARKVAKGMQATDYRLYHRYEEALQDQIDACVGHMARIQKQIDAQLEVVTQLKMDTKSLETIKEARYETYLDERRRKEEAFIDEFVAGRRIAERR